MFKLEILLSASCSARSCGLSGLVLAEKTEQRESSWGGCLPFLEWKLSPGKCSFGLLGIIYLGPVCGFRPTDTSLITYSSHLWDGSVSWDSPSALSWASLWSISKQCLPFYLVASGELIEKIFCWWFHFGSVLVCCLSFFPVQPRRRCSQKGEGKNKNALVLP